MAKEKTKKGTNPKESEGIEKIKDRIKEMKGEILIMNAAVFLLGLVMVIVPDLFDQFIGQILGCVLIVWGVLRCISFLRLKGEEMFGSFALVQGAAMFGFGVFFLVKPDEFKQLLNTVLILIILVVAVLKLQYAINYIKLKVKSWWVHLIAAALMLGFGVIAILKPGDFAVVTLLTRVIGICFVISGIWDTISVLMMSKILKKSVQEAEAAKPKYVPAVAEDKKPAPEPEKKSEKKKQKSKNEETTHFSDPELNDIDNLDYGDQWDEKKK